jgi:hypothetical protein
MKDLGLELRHNLDQNSDTKASEQPANIKHTDIFYRSLQDTSYKKKKAEPRTRVPRRPRGSQYPAAKAQRSHLRMSVQSRRCLWNGIEPTSSEKGNHCSALCRTIRLEESMGKGVWGDNRSDDFKIITAQEQAKWRKQSHEKLIDFGFHFEVDELIWDKALFMKGAI